MLIPISLLHNGFHLYCFVACVFLNAVASKPPSPGLCKCHAWSSLSDGRINEGQDHCHNASYLVCCDTSDENSLPIKSSLDARAIRRSHAKIETHHDQQQLPHPLADIYPQLKAPIEKFCCFEHTSTSPPPFIYRCDSRMIEFVDLKSLTFSNNFSKLSHNLSFQPLMTASIERSLIPNAIMVFFSLFFVFIYCFASLRRDMFRSRIYIERRDCCRLSQQVQMHPSQPSFPPRPPAYSSLPKDPPRYSSIFGSSSSTSFTPPAPISPNPSPASHESLSNQPQTSMQLPVSPPNTASPPADITSAVSTDRTNEMISLYTTPLQVLFLSQKTPTKQARFAQAVRNILTSNQQRRRNPEVVVESTTPPIPPPSAQTSWTSMRALSNESPPFQAPSPLYSPVSNFTFNQLTNQHSPSSSSPPPYAPRHHPFDIILSTADNEIVADTTTTTAATAAIAATTTTTAATATATTTIAATTATASPQANPPPPAISPFNLS